MKKQYRPTNEEVIQMLEDGSLIEQYKNMVYSIAHKMKKCHPQEDFDELVSEGFWGIINWAPRYSPEKSTLTTWIYKSAWDLMKTFCINPKTHRHIPVDFSLPEFAEVLPAKEKWFDCLIRQLGEEAKFLVNIAIEAPGELHDIIKSQAPKTSKKALINYMKNIVGWDDNKLSKVWDEVASCL